MNRIVVKPTQMQMIWKPRCRDMKGNRDEKVWRHVCFTRHKAGVRIQSWWTFVIQWRINHTRQVTIIMRSLLRVQIMTGAENPTGVINREDGEWRRIKQIVPCNSSETHVWPTRKKRKPETHSEEVMKQGSVREKINSVGLKIPWNP